MCMRKTCFLAAESDHVQTIQGQLAYKLQKNTSTHLHIIVGRILFDHLWYFVKEREQNNNRWTETDRNKPQCTKQSEWQTAKCNKMYTAAGCSLCWNISQRIKGTMQSMLSKQTHCFHTLCIQFYLNLYLKGVLLSMRALFAAQLNFTWALKSHVHLWNHFETVRIHWKYNDAEEDYYTYLTCPAESAF